MYKIPVSDGVDHSRFTTEADDPERLEWRRSANEAVLPAHRRHKLTNFAPYDEDRLKFGDQSLRFSLNSMGVRIHKCAFCSFLTRDVCLAHAHFQLHASKKRFGCFSCQRFFDSHESLMIGHSGSVCRKILVLDFFLQCDECWRFFSVESEFINHKVLNQCVNVTKVVCKVCGFTCTKSKINAHMKEHKVDDDFVSNET
ncbi:unnamed protein product [Nesidiocoris tenuis]|uniref:C2H2-type domain-containing protein n=1 Tax=Nesidiocoris tenuis TaxID=355587 RepID=A0A6H5G634_9HEMI|nr:unnamed protein product [Nesidiocoris tenuis]